MQEALQTGSLHLLYRVDQTQRTELAGKRKQPLCLSGMGIYTLVTNSLYGYIVFKWYVECQITLRAAFHHIIMISILFLSLLPLALATVIQAPAPFGRGQSISPADRIYTTDQTSNTITVISPYNRTTLGTLSLGDTRLSDVLGPQYLRAINVHGLGFSRDGKYITAITVASNTVTVIRTVDNTVISNTSVARAPHEAFFTPDGRYVWVGCRATSVVDIVDQFTDGGKVVGSIQTQPGPSKVLFSPDGALAYVNHISSASIAIIAVQNRTVIDTIFGLGDIFSSDMMISADGKRLWAVHKLVGKMSVVDLVRRKVVVVLDTGVESNHPNFFETAQGSTLGYVTVAAENAIKVYRQDREDETPVFVRAVNMTGTEPHGTWGSPDNSMYKPPRLVFAGRC